MGRRRHLLSAGCVALAILTSSCGSPSAPGSADSADPADSAGEAGTSHIDYGDIGGTALVSRFAGPPVPLTGKVAAHRNGCVTVVIDGVERLPLWPRGTTVQPNGDDQDSYLVTLAGGMTLRAGDGFEAAGILSDDTATTPPGSDPPGKAETFLAFCGVAAPPVAFPDAATFRNA